MKRVLLLILIMFCLYACTMNEQQRQAWNHFWCIKTTDDSQSQGQIKSRESYEQHTEYVWIKQGSLTLYENLLNRANSDQLSYKLQKKPFPNPFEASEYEFVLK